MVFGHFCLFYEDLSPDPGLSRYMSQIIYFFHMPAFVFVSGYLAHIRDHLLAKPYLRLILCYAIMNTLMMFYEHIVNKLAVLVIWPYYACWYLLALIFWNLALHVLQRFDLRIALVVFSILAIATGFQSDINRTLAMKNVIAFFPFFIAGHMMREKNVLHIFDKIPVKISGAFLAAASLASMIYLVTNYDFNMVFLQLYPYTGSMFAIKRIICFCISAVVIYALFALLPERNIPLLTKWGKNSLTIYIFHRFVIVVFTAFNSAETYTNTLLIPIAVLTLLICLVLGSDSVSNPFNNFLNMLVNGLTDDMSDPKVKRISYAVLAITFLLALYVCLDPLLVNFHAQI